MKDHTENKIGYFDTDACDLNVFEALITQELNPASVPHASDIQNTEPFYDMSLLRTTLDDIVTRRQLKTV